MHANGRVHQALGPESLLLSTTEESDAASLRARLFDFGSAVDVSDAALLGGPTLGDLWDSGGRGSGAISGFRCAAIMHAGHAALQYSSVDRAEQSKSPNCRVAKRASKFTRIARQHHHENLFLHGSI
jgi:hypothetical protein